MTAEECVDRCLDELGCIRVSDYIRDSLIEFADESGISEIDLKNEKDEAEIKMSGILSVIGSVPEFQRS